MTTAPIPVLQLGGRHPWLRVADAGWDDPLDPSWAERHGGRWNPPGSFPVLYLNEDLRTARAQIHHLFRQWPANPEDLRGDAPYVLVVAALPGRQRVADAVATEGLQRLGLPVSYPLDAGGGVVPHDRCQPVGVAIHNDGLRGVRCRSAATDDGSGREAAWFPTTPRSRARALRDPLPFATWWEAESVDDLAGS